MKRPVNPLQVSRFLRLYEDAAAQKGIKLTIGFDFHKYISLARATPTKEPTTLNFQPDHSPIRLGDGFWMMGADKNNNVAALQAVRLYKLSHCNFAEELEKEFGAYLDLDAYPHDSCTCTSPSAKKMIGKVAYHGDLWVRKDYRGQGMPTVMAGLAFGVAFAMWSPDFVCALVARELLDKGVVAQYGYVHDELGGLKLVRQNVLNEYLLVWLTGEELRSSVDCDHRTKLFSVT